MGSALSSGVMITTGGSSVGSVLSSGVMTSTGGSSVGSVLSSGVMTSTGGSSVGSVLSSGSVPSGAGVAKPYSARYASASSGVAGAGDTPLENTIAMVTGGCALSALLVKYSGSSGT